MNRVEKCEGEEPAFSFAVDPEYRDSGEKMTIFGEMMEKIPRSIEGRNMSAKRLLFPFRMIHKRVHSEERYGVMSP